GWYFRDTAEVRFWMRSGHLIQGQKVWDIARQRNPEFSCANLFWRYGAYAGADYTVIERPMYRKDGVKVPDIYANPMSLRDELQDRLGPFPLFNFWGPNTSIKGSRWIADAAKIVERKYDPTLSLVYLPHMDYGLQRHGPDQSKIKQDLNEIDDVCRELIHFYENRGIEVIVLSEYGITSVNQPVSLNRVLRKHGYITVREEKGGEVLDPGASGAFAVADHQLAHIYVQNTDKIKQVRKLLASVPGVDTILDKNTKKKWGLDHPRSGELVAIAEPKAWFTYYYWLDDDKAPDFAPTVDIHAKPGYDPAEMILDPDISFPKLKAGFTLLKKKLGFRYILDLVPTHGDHVNGSHGRIPDSNQKGPLLGSQNKQLIPSDSLQPANVQQIMLDHIFDPRSEERRVGKGCR